MGGDRGRGMRKDRGGRCALRRRFACGFCRRRCGIEIGGASGPAAWRAPRRPCGAWASACSCGATGFAAFAVASLASASVASGAISAGALSEFCAGALICGAFLPSAFLVCAAFSSATGRAGAALPATRRAFRRSPRTLRHHCRRGSDRSGHHRSGDDRGRYGIRVDHDGRHGRRDRRRSNIGGGGRHLDRLDGFTEILSDDDPVSVPVLPSVGWSVSV